MLRKGFLLLFAWLVLLPAQVVSAQSYSADRFDVLIEMQSDGSFLVTETVVFRFDGGPYTYAFRELALDQLDRVEILSASMDGVELPRGAGAGQVEIDTRGDPYEVTWHFPPTSDQVRTLTLQYRVFGNVRIADGQDVLYWQVIPSEHEYEIDRSRIEILFSSDLRPAAQPRLEGAAAETQIEPGLIRWQVSEIAADQAISARVGFFSGTFIDRPPDWQAESILRSSRLRAAVPFAIAMIVLAAIFTAWWVITQRRRVAERQPLAFQTGELTNPPDELNPAQAGFLVRGLRPHMADGAATLLWLAEKGVIRLREESRRGFLVKTDYRIELLDPNVPLRPHESDLLELLFPDRKQPDKPVYLSGIGVPFAKRWPQISRGLQTEVDGMGYFDEAEANRKKSVELIATILLLAALGAGIVGMFFTLSSGAALTFTGALLLAFSIGLFIFVLAAYIVSSGWVPTTPAGAIRRKRWESFRDSLKEVAQSEQWFDSELLHKYLPFAVAFDLGQTWTKKYRQQGLDAAFPWLVTEAGEQGDVNSMITAMSVISSFGDGGASGDAGAGGGGGGASGAG